MMHASGFNDCTPAGVRASIRGMKIETVVRSLVSGSILYVAIAACSAADSSNAAHGDAGLGDALADAFLDEMGNPVGDALAGPLPPLTAEEPCDKTIQAGATVAKGAIHNFPGKSIADLATLRALLTTVGVGSGAITFDRQIVENVYLNTTGTAMVICPMGQSVTFVLPQ